MSQHYIGVQQVLAWELEKDGRPVYSITYEGGHTTWLPKSIFEAAFVPIGHVGHLPPFHQRLIGERAQLADKLNKLVAFTGSEQFLNLDLCAQIDLNSQLDYMLSYRRVLDERLVALKPQEKA